MEKEKETTVVESLKTLKEIGDDQITGRENWLAFELGEFLSGRISEGKLSSRLASAFKQDEGGATKTAFNKIRQRLLAAVTILRKAHR